MQLKELKQAIKDSDKETVREVLDTYGEEVLQAALDLDIPCPLSCVDWEKEVITC